MTAGLLEGIQALDRGLFLLINRAGANPLFDLLMPLLSDKRAALLPAVALAAWLLWREGRIAWAWLLLAAVAVGLSDLAGGHLKTLLARPRPCHALPEARLLAGCTSSFAMPSNHAANLAAVAVALWLGLPRWGRWLLPLAAAVAYSRVYLGVHYPSDVLGGALLGAGLAWGVVAAGRRLLPRLRRPPAPEGLPTPPGSGAIG